MKHRFVEEALDEFIADGGYYNQQVPLRQTKALQLHYRTLPPSAFTPHWAGFAIASQTFQPRGSTLSEPCYRYIQRSGQRSPSR